MHPLTVGIIALTMVGKSFAQTSTISLYIPGADPSAAEMVASVVNSDATVTTYVLQCAPGTDSNDCGFDVFTLTEGPAVAKYTIAPETFNNGSLAFTANVDCSLVGTISAVCVESYGGPLANDPGVQTITYSGTDFQYQPVIVTAGPKAGSGSSPSSAAPSTTTNISTASKTASSADNAPTPTNTASTITNAASNLTNTGPTITATAKSANSLGISTQSSSSKTASSTGGAAAVTGKAWALVGTAAMLAMMA